MCDFYIWAKINIFIVRDEYLNFQKWIHKIF